MWAAIDRRHGFAGADHTEVGEVASSEHALVASDKEVPARCQAPAGASSRILEERLRHDERDRAPVREVEELVGAGPVDRSRAHDQ